MSEQMKTGDAPETVAETAPEMEADPGRRAPRRDHHGLEVRRRRHGGRGEGAGGGGGDLRGARHVRAPRARRRRRLLQERADARAARDHRRRRAVRRAAGHRRRAHRPAGHRRPPHEPDVRARRARRAAVDHADAARRAGRLRRAWTTRATPRTWPCASSRRDASGSSSSRARLREPLPAAPRGRDRAARRLPRHLRGRREAGLRARRAVGRRAAAPRRPVPLPGRLVRVGVPAGRRRGLRPRAAVGDRRPRARGGDRAARRIACSTSAACGTPTASPSQGFDAFLATGLTAGDDAPRVVRADDASRAPSARRRARGDDPRPASCATRRRSRHGRRAHASAL